MKRRLTGLLLTLISAISFAEENIVFDHFATGFPLSGQHTQVTCNNCHQDGLFKGTPMECHACHSDRGKINASIKNVEHINSSERCDFCHVTDGWEIVIRVDHFEVRGVCTTCHNGLVASGKHAAHIQTTGACDICHTTNFWAPIVRFDHGKITTERCDGCHNNTDGIAEGVDADHIPIGNTDCGSCHTTNAWLPATFGR